MRQFLFLLISFGFASGSAIGQTGIFVPSMAKVDTLVKDFMGNWGIQGGAVAITKGGRLVYNRGFYYLDGDYRDRTQPYHRFRIASVSKPITAIAIMKLLGAAGITSLDDLVFGHRPGILQDSIFLQTHRTAQDSIYRRAITVRHLLEHEAGWDRDIPCYGSGCDPIGFPLHVTSTTKMPNPAGDSAYITFLIQKGFDFEPGTRRKYSNIGYSVLGLIIERQSGKQYHEFVTDSIFKPLGLCDFALARNKLADKAEREAEYISSATMLDCYGNGTTVKRQYGGYNIESFKGAGGWIGTASELARVLVSVDGFSNVPDLLPKDLLDTMVTPTGTDTNYAKGWSVRRGLWWHDGSLPGTSAFVMVRAADSVTMAFVFNQRDSVDGYFAALRRLALTDITGFTYPAHDYFPVTTNVSDLRAVKTNPSTVQLDWTNGSGTERIVVGTTLDSFSTYPVDGDNYAGDFTYGKGSKLDTNTYVVYRGSGSSWTVYGLDESRTYRFTAYESHSTNTGGLSIYKIGCHPVVTVKMAASGVGTTPREEIAIYPNPATKSCTVEAGGKLWNTYAVLYDITGRERANIRISGKVQKLQLETLLPGIYFLRFANGQVLKLTRQ